ncbi:MAG TPA: hypothetical protein VFC68_06140 [Treponemataceae bacterium]|nr:hypothetical protein [Treponemataceae bacterium]
MKKKLYCIAIVLVITVLATANENQTVPIDEKDQPGNFFLELGHLSIINTVKNSAPTPHLFSLGAGYEIPINPWLSFSPQTSIYVATYLWNNELQTALPAEIEHRTTTVPSLIIQIPAKFVISTEMFRIGIQPGLSFFLRYGIQSTKILENEQADVSRINKWFYSKGRFFYPSLQINLDRFFTKKIRAGIAATVYLPIGSIIEKTLPQDISSTLTCRIFFTNSK